MSGRRSKSLRKRFAVGALVACSALGAKVDSVAAQTTTGRAGGSGQPAELPLRQFDIPAGSVAEALRAFESITGIRVRADVDREVFANYKTPGVSGLLPAADALGQILSQSGLTYRFVNNRTVAISLRTVSEAIDVMAPAPVVSSPKFTQPLLDTPRTVAVITDEVFVAQGATTLRDVLRNTPGITFQAGEGGSAPGDSFSMRGFSAANDVFVDGVRESSAYSRDAFNLEQVEVIKGPSGVIAGRGGTGGAVNLVTKTPRLEPFTRASLAGGNAAFRRVMVDTNLALSMFDDAAFRIAAMHTASDTPGRDLVHNSSWGVAPSLSFGIGKPSRFTIAFQHVTQDNVPDYGLPWAALEEGVDQSNFYGLEGYDYEDVTSDVATASYDRDLASGWTLRNVSRWADNHRDSAITAPRPPNRQLQQRLMDQGQLTNQTSLSGSFRTGSVEHDFVGGVEIGRETTFVRRQAQSTNQPQTDLSDPDPGQSPIGPMPVNNGDPQDTSLSLAGIYVADTLQLGQQWELTAGLRWDDVDVESELTDVSTGQTTLLERADRMLSWNTGVVYKPRANASLYVSAGTSFNPSVEASTGGAVLSDSPTSASNVNLAPEESRNLEVGGKWEAVRGRLVATGAIFRTEKTNARTRGERNEPYVLDGEQLVEGVEIGMTGNITDRWSVLASFAHLDSEFTASVNPLEEGAALAFVPENSFNVWSEAQVIPRLSLGAGAQFMDSVFRNAENTAEVPSYWLLSAMASYDVSQLLTLRLNVNNLADEQFVDRVGGGHYIPGARRSIMLSAEVDF